jgi:hypothetical protein
MESAVCISFSTTVGLYVSSYRRWWSGDCLVLLFRRHPFVMSADPSSAVTEFFFTNFSRRAVKCYFLCTAACLVIFTYLLTFSDHSPIYGSDLIGLFVIFWCLRWLRTRSVNSVIAQRYDDRARQCGQHHVKTCYEQNFGSGSNRCSNSSGLLTSDRHWSSLRALFFIATFSYSKFRSYWLFLIWPVFFLLWTVLQELSTGSRGMRLIVLGLVVCRNISQKF